MLMMPIIVLFFMENGLTMTNIFVLQSLFSVAVIVFEIPSGYFADRYGRKRALVLGSVLGFISFAIYAVAGGFWEILAAELVMGIGFAFISGADSALLYDSLQEIGEVDTYKRREGIIVSVYTFSEAAASVLGGFIALISLRAPFVAQAVVMFFLIPVALSLKEPVRALASPESKMWTMRAIIAHTLRHNAVLKWLIIFYGIITTAGLVAVWIRQPYMEQAGIPLEYFGFIWAALMLTVSIATLSADYVERRIGRWNSLGLLIILATVGYFLLATTVVWWLVPAMLFFSIARGFVEPIIKEYVQHHATSDVRATVLSIKGFVARGFFAVMGPIAGWMVDAYSLQFALLASGVGFLIAGIAALYVLRVSEKRIEVAAAAQI